jgi:VanZ family protein
VWPLWVWGPVAAQALAIFYLSSLPDLGPIPGGVNDKTGHVLGYGVLAVVLLRAFAGGRLGGVTWRRGVGTILLSSLYGASDEFHQSFVPGRSPDPADWVADTAGAFGAVVAILLLVMGARRRRPDAEPGRGR